MTATPQSKGIVGAISGGTSRAIHAAGEMMDSALVRVFVFLVVGSAMMATWEHVSAKATTTLSFYKLLFLGVGAILAELMGVHRAIKHWHKAEGGSMLAWSAIWALGFAFSLYNALGSSATFQAKREGAQKAAFTKTVNVSKNLEQARAAYQAEERNYEAIAKMALAVLPSVDGQPVANVAAADALISGYKSNTRFWDHLTDHCTKTGGKETRKFCADYNAAVAAKADLEGRKDLDGKLVQATNQRDAAKNAFLAAEIEANNTETVISEATPFVQAVSYVSGHAPEQVAWIEPAQTSLTNMLMVSFAGLILGLAGINGQPRTKWVNWRGIYTALYRALFGGSAPGTHTVTERTVERTKLVAADPRSIAEAVMSRGAIA